MSCHGMSCVISYDDIGSITTNKQTNKQTNKYQYTAVYPSILSTDHDYGRFYDVTAMKVLINYHYHYQYQYRFSSARCMSLYTSAYNIVRRR